MVQILCLICFSFNCINGGLELSIVSRRLTYKCASADVLFGIQAQIAVSVCVCVCVCVCV